MITYGDWFTGFGGMTLGAKAAGLDVLFGAEYDQAIADVYRRNLGDHVIVCDLLDIPVTAFPRVDVFHASPPCPSFSIANPNGEETERDIALAEKVAEYIVYHLPDVFTLENVYQYRLSKSWQKIAQALHDHGYLFNYWHVNMADYGVPQTRKRMIVIARRDGVMPSLPHATHTADPIAGLFGTMPRWVSWYEAIEDLIPSLPDSEFAPRQLSRLPEEMRTLLFNGMDMKSTGRQMLGRGIDEPSATIIADDARRPSTMPTAVIVNDADSKNPIRTGNEPAATVVTFDTGGTLSRAFVVDGQNAGRELTGLKNSQPFFTTQANGKAAYRAFISGRVVQMTPRCLARFQSFPDWYALPSSKKLACQGIGNAVPALFAEKLYRSLIGSNHENLHHDRRGKETKRKLVHRQNGCRS